MDLLSTRELASLFWLSAILLFCLCKPELVKGLGRVLKAFFVIKIVFMFEALAVYLLGVVCVLMQFLTWDLGAAKAIILWYFLVGAPLLFKSATADQSYNPLQTWVKNTFAFVIIIEFLISKYTLPFFAELVLIPLVTFIAMMVVVAERDPEHKQVHTFLSWVMAAIGFWLISMSISSFVENAETEFNMASLEEFSLPILLSLLTIPFFYGLHLYSSYERVFSTLNVWVKDERFKRKMRRSAIFAFGPNIRALMRWKRLSFGDKPANEEELMRTIDEAKRVERLEKKPPAVSPIEGWSPYVSKSFLKSSGVTMFDYREYDGRWHADSSIIEIHKSAFSNFIVYMVEGSETVADTLRLKLTLNSPEHREEGLGEHRDYVKLLLDEAVSESFAEAFDENVGDEAEFDFSFGNYVARQSLKVIEAPNLTIEEYDFRLSTKAVDKKSG